MASTRGDRPSRSEINRSGDVLRAWWAADGNDLSDEVVAAFDIVEDFRASFQYPLRKVTVGLRQFVQRESIRLDVAQRLKRMPTIVDKLRRLPEMELVRMQDIGGCRAVLPGGAVEIAGVLRRIRRNWDVRRVYDYVAEPKATGYRAVHPIVRRDGRDIHIQLRTQAQHEWAFTVEVWSGRFLRRYGFSLKDGEGPEHLLHYFEIAALALHLDEAGEPVDHVVTDELDDLREQVRDLFVGK